MPSGSYTEGQTKTVALLSRAITSARGGTVAGDAASRSGIRSVAVAAEASRWKEEGGRAAGADDSTVVGDDAAQLAVPVEEFVHVLRLLTFAGSHQKVADGRLLAPEQIVDVVLHGTLNPQKTQKGRD